MEEVRAIAFDPAWSPWALRAIGGLLAAAWLAGWVGTRRLPLSRRAALGALRLGALGALLFAILEPSVLEEERVRKRSTVAVIADASASMGLPAEAGGPSRAATLAAWFARRERRFEDLAERFDLAYFRFAEGLEPIRTLAELAEAPAGGATDVARALESLATRLGDKPLAAAILVTDGADTAGLAEADDPAAALGDALRSLGAPVHVVGVGRPDALRDFAIVDVRHDAYGFVKTPMEVTAVVESSGYGPTTVPITLRSGAEVLAVAAARLEPGRNEVPLRFAPAHAGRFAYAVAAPVYAGEAIAENNARSFTVQVVRDRVRVLHVVGRPSWDERFLRRVLKRSPNLDVISFFILRTPEDSVAVPQHELSLIPFPTDELFTTEMKGFDLIVLQNFNYRPYVQPEYVANMARYVRDGGALAMIGGDLSFSPGGYEGTALEDVLPVSLSGTGAPFILGDYAARPAEAALAHPIMRLAGSPAESLAIWRGLPTLEGANRVASVRPGARVLAWGPSDPQDPDGAPAPLVAVGEAGKGRVLAVMTDTTWRWSFLGADRAGAPDAYERFWDGAIRWLIRDPEYASVRVRAEATGTGAVSAEAEVLGADYRAARGEGLRLRVEDPTTGEKLHEEDAVTDGAGKARLLWRPERASSVPGFYRVVAEHGEERADALAETAADYAETRSVRLGHGLLRSIARASGGAFSTLDDDSALFGADWRGADRYELRGRKARSLWDTPWLLALFTALTGLEWYWRKRWGLA